jgi:hypothetical protein
MLFDIGADPSEQDDLAAAEPAVVERLAAWATKLHEETTREASRFDEAEPLQLSPAEIAALEALGYVGGR